MIINANRQLNQRTATAAVEAALILPVLILFTAAILDLGRLGKFADCVSNAARNGAQYGMVNTTAAADSAGIRAAAVTEMANLPNVTATNPAVTATIVSNGGSNYIQCKVDYTMTTFFQIYVVTHVIRTVEMPMMPQ